jgi:hypothetical protein
MMFDSIFNSFYNILGVILLLIGIVIFAVGFVWFRRKRLIENIPTSKIRSLAMGLVEINGVVVPYQEKLLVSPLTKKNCVYYHYLVERYEEHYNPKTKRKEGHWVMVQNEKQNVQFSLKDDTGMVLVDPNRADVDVKKDYQTRQGNMRYSEWYIEPNDALYILGTAAENPYQKEAPAVHEENIMIQKGQYEKQYMISDKSEKQILKTLTILTYGTWCMGIVFILIGIVLLLR